MTWQETAAKVQRHRDETIAAIDPPVPSIPEKLPLNVTGIHAQLLPADVVSITETAPELLIKQLAAGELSCTAVTKAFLQRAGLASRLTNCVTEVLPDRSLKRAKYLDGYLATNGKPVGPLHGLPISIKEHAAMRGLNLDAGFVSWVGTVPSASHSLLHLLWAAGAVFYVRTTQPQLLMHLETSSNLYGETTNPFNTALTSGGSSGGEGSLIGQGGSCLGLGSDIGGSIRSPAANNGVFGLKPTSWRLPIVGNAAAMLGADHIPPCVGPLSTSLEGLKIFMKAVIEQRPWIHYPSFALPMPWNDPQNNPNKTLLRVDSKTGHRKLRVGIMEDDGVVRPHPPILRGLRMVTSALASHPDIEVVPFKPYRHAEAWRIISLLYYADDGAEDRIALEASGEPLRPLSEWIMNQSGHKYQGVEGIWKLTMEREYYRALYAKHWQAVGTPFPGPSDSDATFDVTAPFGPNLPLQTPINDMAEEGTKYLDPVPFPTASAIEEQSVDVLLCPVGPGCAPPLNCARYWGYTSQWNLLDYPALSFPTGLQCGPEDKVEENYVPRGVDDEYNYKLCE